MHRNLKALLDQMINAAGIQMDQIACQRASADGFHNESAGDIMAFSDHTRVDYMLTP